MSLWSASWLACLRWLWIKNPGFLLLRLWALFWNLLPFALFCLLLLLGIGLLKNWMSKINPFLPFLQEEVYMKQPSGFVDSPFPTHFWRRQTLSRWKEIGFSVLFMVSKKLRRVAFTLSSSYLLSLGLTSCTSETSFFLRTLWDSKQKQDMDYRKPLVAIECQDLSALAEGKDWDWKIHLAGQ